MKLRKLIPVSVLGIAALALAGCSVFDGDDDDDGPNITQSQLDKAIAATATAQDRVTTLEGELETTQDSIEALTEERNTAQARVTALEDMLTTEQETVARLTAEIGMVGDGVVMGNGLREELAAAQASVTALEGEITTERAKVTALEGQLVDVQDELAQFKLDAKKLLTKAATDERIARELKVGEAILANKVTNSAKLFPLGITAQEITRDADGTLTVDVNGKVEDVYMGGEGTAGSDAWNSVIMTKTDALGTEDTLVIYTDIAEPEDVLLTTRYGESVLADVLADSLNVEKAQSDGFPSDPGTTYDYTGVAGERAKTVVGTFDGVPGQFTCSGDVACTVENNAMGALVAVGTWRFTPGAPFTAKVKVPDTNYVYFGWWLKKPAVNTVEHALDVFAGGTMNHLAEVTTEIVGNATYSGPAAGKYVTKSFTGGAHLDSAVGHFTARANLTAKFGAEDDDRMIDGTVTNFMLDDTSPVSWSVTLKEAPLSVGVTAFSGMSEVNFGGALTEDAGTWQGNFYDADADGTNAPGTVAGTFDAVTDNAAVIGGFGATKQ